MSIPVLNFGTESANPVDTGRKLNVHKTFRRRPGRLLNVLCTFNLRLLSTGKELTLYELFFIAIYSPNNDNKHHSEMRN